MVNGPGTVPPYTVRVAVRLAFWSEPLVRVEVTAGVSDESYIVTEVE
jgi:hypothetical protein